MSVRFVASFLAVTLLAPAAFAGAQWSSRDNHTGQLRDASSQAVSRFGTDLVARNNVTGQLEGVQATAPRFAVMAMGGYTSVVR